jgi:hypothetical protein
VIEVSFAVAVVWQFSAADPERRERAALRIVGGSFLALAAGAVREGWQAWRGDACCPPIGTVDPGRSTDGCVEGCCTGLSGCAPAQRAGRCSGVSPSTTDLTTPKQ